MKGSGGHILKTIHKKWQLRIWLEITLYGIGLGLLAYAITSNLWVAVAGFSGLILILSLVLKPWSYSIAHVCHYLDVRLPNLEYSSSLLLQDENQLTQLAQLQRKKISKELVESTAQLRPERSLKTALITTALLIFAALIIHQFELTDLIKGPDQSVPEKGIIFSTVDSTGVNVPAPLLVKQSVTVRYPRYTGQASKNTSDMNLKELQGSKISWYLEFDTKVKSVTLQHSGEDKEMALSKEGYRYAATLQASGFYNLKFIDSLGRAYYSELYSLEAVPDKSPLIEVSGLSQLTSFDVEQNKDLNFKALISDDYGLANAAIIATVSKGSGESVKFREESLSFDNTIPKGSKKAGLTKRINLDSLAMEPGDELYFYIEVYDVKHPNPNITRGDTYFANIRDTIRDVFEVDGTMGVDQMPDYFRSQRQLIIDTEKLIKEKPEMSEHAFKSKSNELAFDQKALRIKYGEFMGDESTLGINSDDGHDEEEENLLAEYEHNHDTENESNLVVEETEDESSEETEEDPLHDYIHHHDDQEEATLFSETLKTKLRKALTEMWDAELHLRLYHPKESLPIQYSILKRLQDIKNSARIYVHRIGFDPPPIKEDKRLTGDLDEIYSYRKTADLERAVSFPNSRMSIARLEELISNGTQILEGDKILFEAAGNEIAELAIEHPGNYLTTLQALKKLSQGFQMSLDELTRVQKGLVAALPSDPASPEKIKGELDELNTLFIQELETHD